MQSLRAGQLHSQRKNDQENDSGCLRSARRQREYFGETLKRTEAGIDMLFIDSIESEQEMVQACGISAGTQSA